MKNVNERIKCKNALEHNLANMKFDTKCKYCGLTVKEIYLDDVSFDNPPKPTTKEPKKSIFSRLMFWRKDKTKEQLRLKKLFETEKNVIVLQEAKKLQLPSLKTDCFLLHEKVQGSNNLKFSAISNYQKLYKSHGSSFMLSDEILKIDNKPTFLIKNGYPMSLNIQTVQIQSQMETPKDDYEIVFDDKGFNTLLEHVTYNNLKVKTDKNAEFWSFISDNWLMIIIVIAVMIIIFATPQGKEFLQNFLNSVAQTGKN